MLVIRFLGFFHCTEISGRWRREFRQLIMKFSKDLSKSLTLKVIVCNRKSFMKVIFLCKSIILFGEKK